MMLDSRCLLLLLGLLPLSSGVMAEDDAPDLALLEFLGGAEQIESAGEDAGADQWIDPLQMFDTWQAEEAEATSLRAKNTEVKNDD